MQKRQAQEILAKLRKLHETIGRKSGGSDPLQLTLDSLYDGNRGKSKK